MQIKSKFEDLIPSVPQVTVLDVLNNMSNDLPGLSDSLRPYKVRGKVCCSKHTIKILYASVILSWSGALSVFFLSLRLRRQLRNGNTDTDANACKQTLQVGLEDEREGLRGEWGLRTDNYLEKHTILAPYAGEVYY